MNIVYRYALGGFCAGGFVGLGIGMASKPFFMAGGFLTNSALIKEYVVIQDAMRKREILNTSYRRFKVVSFISGAALAMGVGAAVGARKAHRLGLKLFNK